LDETVTIAQGAEDPTGAVTLEIQNPVVLARHTDGTVVCGASVLML